MCKGIIYVTCFIAVNLIPAHFCKPVNTMTESILNKDRSPCHVANADPATKLNRKETEVEFVGLKQRIVEVLYKINEIKQKITSGSNIIEKCVTSAFSYQTFSLPCSSIANMTRQSMAECIVSSYKTLNQFSDSIKTIENYNYTSESKENLRYVLQPIEDLDIVSDQLLCEMYLDLKRLGYIISLRQLSNKHDVSLLSGYTEQTEATDNSACFYQGSELNQMQILRIIYQFVDIYSNVLEEMKDLFSNEKYSDITDTQQNSLISSAVTHSPNQKILEIVIG